MSLSSRYPQLNGLLFGLLILCVLGGAFWANYRFVLSNSGGDGFLISWMRMRGLILEGTSPYSSEASPEFYNNRSNKVRVQDVQDKIFSDPLYGGVIYMPFALIENYLFARSLWLTALEAVIFFLILSSLSLIGWRPRFWLLALFFVFSFTWYHALLALITEGIVIILAIVTVVGLSAICKEKDELAGIMLALLTIKFNIVALFIIFVVLWAISRRRWRLIGWAFGSELLLIIFGLLFVPDWPIEYIREVLLDAYLDTPGSVGSVLMGWLPGIGQQLVFGFTLLMGSIVLIEWWFAWQQDFDWFLWTACLTLVASQWILIQTKPSYFIELFPALVLVYAIWDKRWGRIGRYIIVISMFVIFFGLWWLFIHIINLGNQPEQRAILLFVLPSFLLVGLYWIRWWAIRPKRISIDEPTI